MELWAPEGTWLVIASAQWRFTPDEQVIELIELPATCWIDGVTNGPITLFEGGPVVTATWGTATATALASSGTVTLSCDGESSVTITNLTVSIQRVSS